MQREISTLYQKNGRRFWSSLQTRTRERERAVGEKGRRRWVALIRTTGEHETLLH